MRLHYKEGYREGAGREGGKVGVGVGAASALPSALSHSTLVHSELHIFYSYFEVQGKRN